MYCMKGRKKAGRCRRQTPRKAARRWKDDRLDAALCRRIDSRPTAQRLLPRQRLPPAANIAPYLDRRRLARPPTDGLQTADNCPTLLPMPLGAMLPIVRAWRPSAWSACAYNRYCYRLQAYSPRKRLPLPPQVSPEPSTYEHSRQDTTGQHSSAPTTHTRKRLSPPPLASLPLLPAITSRKHDRPPECVTDPHTAGA